LIEQFNLDVVFKSSVNYLHYPEIVVNHLLHIYNDEDTSYIITDQTKGKMDVELKGLAKSFGKVTAINNMNLEIEQGEFLVLLGPSGCGKTTALRMIAGLETIETGELYIGGKLMNEVLPKYRDVAMVFQSYALYPHMIVEENIGYPLKMKGVKGQDKKDAILKAAKLVQLDDLLHRYPKQLSGGQRQRVALARALVRRPRVFLMDEPLSNLDAKLRGQMRAELKHMQHQLGITTIYVTHDQIEAMTLASRVAIMNEGVLQQIDSPKNIYNDPDNLFVAGFIGSPPMNLIHGEIESGNFFAEGCLINNVEKDSKKDVILGIRPEDMEIVQKGTSHLEATLYSIELTGDQTIVTSKMGSNFVTINEDKDFESNLDLPVKIKLDKAKIYFFDSLSGERIRS
jgi:multiple sugar transport system ATP-binding protein